VPDRWFERDDDPVWPRHWKTFPRAWRETAGNEEHSAEIRAVIARTIEELPEEWRTVIELRDVEGLTLEEVSRRLHMSDADQTVALHSARATVLEALAPYFQEPST